MNMSYVHCKDGIHGYELRKAARMVYMNMSYIHCKDGIHGYELRTRQGWYTCI